ncbi:MAG: hypothetical protein ABIW46_02290, partial [Acidimicrobiales bacterium]
MRGVLVSVALTLAACGSPAARTMLSEGEFVGRARLICGELDRQADLADDSLLAAGEEDLADARRVVAGFAPLVADARAALVELGPPRSQRAAADAYVAALERAQSEMEAAGASEESTRRFLAGGGGVAAGLGIDACVGGPEVDTGQDEEARSSLR